MEQDIQQKHEKKSNRENKRTSDQESRNEDLYRQYHPAFCDAMIQIFEHDTCKYDYEKEYHLNSMPNRIDFMIIKKRSNSERILYYARRS